MHQNCGGKSSKISSSQIANDFVASKDPKVEGLLVPCNMIPYSNKFQCPFLFLVCIDKLIADQFAGCYITYLGENDQADSDNLSDIDDVEVHLYIRYFN